LAVKLRQAENMAEFNFYLIQLIPNGFDQGKAGKVLGRMCKDDYLCPPLPETCAGAGWPVTGTSAANAGDPRSLLDQ
jgi:hypothetical protein